MHKKLLLLAALTAISFIMTAQQLNQLDDRGMKQGKWRKTHENGSIKYEGQFRNDKPYGVFKYYYEDTQIKAISRFSNDGLVTYTETFHPNGQPMAKGKYVNQKRDSTWNFYSDIDGKLIAKENYRKDRLQGENIVYFPENGTISEITTYVSNQKEGPYRKYFPDGSLMTEGSYKNGQLDGDFTVYFNDGSIEIKGQYKMGIKYGNWEYYNEDGESLTEEEFRKQAQ